MDELDKYSFLLLNHSEKLIGFGSCNTLKHSHPELPTNKLVLQITSMKTKPWE